LLSEGQLRLLHRKVQPADKSGAELPPVHSYARRDGATVTPGAVMDIRLRLLPIAIRLPTGTRVRLAVAGADADTFGAPLVAASSASPTRIISSAPPTLAISSAPPTFTFHYGPAIDCWLDLPITAPAAPDACSRR
jgi:predicted acyl esterase